MSAPGWAVEVWRDGSLITYWPVAEGNDAALDLRDIFKRHHEHADRYQIVVTYGTETEAREADSLLG